MSVRSSRVAGSARAAARRRRHAERGAVRAVPRGPGVHRPRPAPMAGQALDSRRRATCASPGARRHQRAADQRAAGDVRRDCNRYHFLQRSSHRRSRSSSSQTVSTRASRTKVRSNLLPTISSRRATSTRSLARKKSSLKTVNASGDRTHVARPARSITGATPARAREACGETRAWAAQEAAFCTTRREGRLRSPRQGLWCREIGRRKAAALVQCVAVAGGQPFAVYCVAAMIVL